MLPLDSVTALGMAVAELVTNGYRHAFPDDREGTIVVTLASADVGNAIRRSRTTGWALTRRPRRQGGASAWFNNWPGRSAGWRACDQKWARYGRWYFQCRRIRPAASKLPHSHLAWASLGPRGPDQRNRPRTTGGRFGTSYGRSMAVPLAQPTYKALGFLIVATIPSGSDG